MGLAKAFERDNSDYKRDLNFIKTYVHNAAYYLSNKYGKTYDDCHAWVMKNIKADGGFPAVDPRVKITDLDSNMDRFTTVTTMSNLMSTISKNDLITSPSLAVYVPSKRKKSLTAAFVQGGLKERSENKKAAFKHGRAGDAVLANIYNNRQKRNKIKNNSISGAHVTQSSVLHLKSAHSSLTSTCRSASNSTNANVERLLGGNRHYWNHEIALANITSIVSSADLTAVRRTMKKYNLTYPTHQQVVRAVTRCTNLYWKREDHTKKIVEYVFSLNDDELAAYLFCADLYNLKIVNPEFTRELFTRLANPCDDPVDNPMDYINACGEDEIAMLGIVANKHLKCRAVFDSELKDTTDLKHAGGVAKYIGETMDYYDDFFVTFWCTMDMAPDVYSFPESLRTTVIGGDTDSCIYTNEDWCEWYTGSDDLTEESFNVAAVTTYLASLHTYHAMAMMSGNLGVEDVNMRLLAMKNEYAFKFFVLTTMAKHYFGSMDAVEGVVYKKPKWEIKGSTLKNTTATVDIINGADQLIKYMGQKIMNNEKLSLTEILKEVADIELNVYDTIARGDCDFFKMVNIKDKSAYSNGGPYFHYELWEAVFAEKYGHIESLPYRAVKINLNLQNKTEFAEWVSSMKDRNIADKLVQWMGENKKDMLGVINVPEEVLAGVKLPEELLPAVRIRTIIRDLMKSYYLILESLGYLVLNKHVTRLVIDDIYPGKVPH